MNKTVKRAWEDEDDRNSGSKHRNLAPRWLQKFEEEEKDKGEKGGESEDSDEEDAVSALYGMSRTAAKYLRKSELLPRMYLKACRIRDITGAHAHQGELGALKFHPTQPVLLLASKQGISLYQVSKSVDDLQQNRGDAFLQNVAFKRFPIDYMSFYDDASSVVATSKRSFNYYTYNMLNGHVSQNVYPRAVTEGNDKRRGHLVRLSSDGELIAIVSRSVEVFIYAFKTMEHIHTFMASDEVADICFSPTDRMKLYALTTIGSFHIWDLRETQGQKVLQDEGSFHGTVLGVSSNEQFLACGSNTGIVNVYETTAIQMKQDPRPIYTLENLTTSVGFLRFNHNSETLAFGSSEKAMAYRFLHTKSGTVFKNFPPKHEMLNHDHFTCVDISPNSGFAAFGNSNGSVRLYRLNHYKAY